jgi:hypothetical protein
MEISMSDTIVLAGQVREWDFGGKSRKFVDVCLSFAQARQVFKPKLFSALSGHGEQRPQTASQLRTLRGAILGGTYTPTPLAASLRKQHRESMLVDGGSFRLEVSADKPLALTDGGHRMRSLEDILADFRRVADDPGAGADVREHALQAIEQLGRLPISATVYLDGDIQADFLNLQKGVSVDRSHILSLTARKEYKECPELSYAIEIAKALHKDPDSPFASRVRFDANSAAKLPVNTLCAKGSSDLATSLVGLAKLVLSDGPRHAGEAASFVTAAYNAVKADAPDLLEEGKILDCVNSKGGATMVCGLGLALYYLCKVRGEDSPSPRSLRDLVEAARGTLDERVVGNFSGGVKREAMRQLAMALFSREDCEMSSGVPSSLLAVIPKSAFGVKK